METAKLYDDGEHQVVLLPEAFHIHADEVRVEKVGDMITLTPIEPELPIP